MDNRKPPASANNSNLFPCPDCGANVRRGDYNCPTCGKKLHSTPVNVLVWIGLGCLALGVLIAAWPQIEPLVRWTAYPNQKEDEQNYQRALEARDWQLRRTGRYD